MKDFAPIAAAGATITVLLLGCLAGAIYLTAKTGNPIYIFIGLGLGLMASGYSAFRLLSRTK